MQGEYFESPFHVTHDQRTASKMALKVDLSIFIIKVISERGWSQAQAALELGVHQSRISDLKTAKIERFTIDAMFDMLDELGFQADVEMSSTDQAAISIVRC